ncbi:hypothetical protein [Cupriavidus basilensis]
MNMNAMWLRCASRFEGLRAGGIVVVPLLAVLFAGGCSATYQAKSGADAGTENTQATNDAASEREKNRALCRKGLELVNAGVIPALTLLMNKDCMDSAASNVANKAADAKPGAGSRSPGKGQEDRNRRSWMLDVPGIPPEIIPGAKLGYSKEESARRLRPEVRELLAGILKIMDRPDQYMGRQAIYDALHVTGGKRVVRYTDMPDGTKDFRFREDLLPQGVFANPAWTGLYSYNGRTQRDKQPGRSIEVEIDITPERDCIDSRAVEGYLDLYVDPRIIARIHPLPREAWDRHGPGGHSAYVTGRNPLNGLRLGFIDGCWSHMTFGNFYPESEVADATIFHR